MSRATAPRLPDPVRPPEFVPLLVVRWLGRSSRRRLRSEAEIALALHLAYGSALGAAYGVARSRTARLPAPLAGAGFGTAAWAVGFEGWLPALGITPSPRPAAQRLAPLLGHLFYGIAVALAYDALRGPAPAKSPAGLPT